MQIDKGRVLARSGDTLIIGLERHKECVSCALAQFCGDIKGEAPRSVAVTSPELKIGGQVEVMVDESILLRASIIVYGVSLLSFLMGLFLGYGFSFLIKLNENLAILFSVLSGFLLFIPGAILVRRATKKLKLNFKNITKIN